MKRALLPLLAAILLLAATPTPSKAAPADDVTATAFGKDLEAGETADAFWVKKAGLQALPLLSPGRCPTNFFSQLEKLMPALKDVLEKKKTALEAAKN